VENENPLKGGTALAIETIRDWITDFYALLPNLVVGFILLILFGLLAYSVKRAITSFFERRDRVDLGAILGDFGFWGFLVFGLLMSLMIIIPSLNPADILASFGIGSIALGFAFKDILQNWLAGLLILLRLPFRRGDQIVIGDVEGTVQRIEPRATILQTYDGRDIIIPNTIIYTGIVTINTSQKMRRVEIELTIGYAYPIRKIQDIIFHAIDPIDEIVKDPLPQILCTELGSTSLAMKVRWWIEPSRSNEVISKSRAIQAIKEAFDANDIDPTDPELVYYQQDTGVPESVDDDTTEIRKVGPPPGFEISDNDPEVEQPKQDSKSGTMLTDTK